VKALLVYPAISLGGFGKRHNPGGEARWIPHGLGMVATCARAAGFDVDVLDLRDLAGWEDFEGRIAEARPGVVGVSVSYVDYRPALQAIDAVKRLAPTTKVVVGGILPSNFPDLFLEDERVDHVVIGEGEISFVELLQAMEEGLCYPKLVVGKRPDLDGLPFLDRELFDHQAEMSTTFCPAQKAPVITMIAGRGCPYNCAYCQPAERSVFGSHRLRSPKNVVAELEELRAQYAFESITWWDDTFTVSPKWVREFCDLYQSRGFKATMVACSRADIVCRNEGMVERLAEVGTVCLVIGMESGSQRILDLLGKGTTVEQNLQAAEICRRHGIEVYATAMLGLPTETNEEAASTMDMLERMDPDVVNLFYFNPIPGTRLYAFCEQAGLILRNDPFAIARTGEYSPKIEGVDYGYLDKLRATRLQSGRWATRLKWTRERERIRAMLA